MLYVCLILSIIKNVKVPSYAFNFSFPGQKSKVLSDIDKWTRQQQYNILQQQVEKSTHDTLSLPPSSVPPYYKKRLTMGCIKYSLAG